VPIGRFGRVVDPARSDASEPTTTGDRTPTHRAFPPGDGRVVLAVMPHADDLVLFLGGTVGRWVDAGWRVVLVRVTDDRWDSVGMSEHDTIVANAAELRASCEVLGVDTIVEFGMATDVLGDTSTVALRERIIREVRRHRPYALVTLDPHSRFAEDNLDHVVVSRAVDEAFWTSQFDLHHPEHLAEGLAPHGCFERWYAGRRVGQVTDVVDIASTLDRKVRAAACHRTMLRNYANQLVLQARTGGWELPLAADAARSGDVAPLIEPLLHAEAAAVGARYGLAAAEELRVVTFGGLGALLEQAGRRIPS
jgi:LmbE family N-acetylglucosaminyl deacetylase